MRRFNLLKEYMEEPCVTSFIYHMCVCGVCVLCCRAFLASFSAFHWSHSSSVQRGPFFLRRPVVASHQSAACVSDTQVLLCSTVCAELFAPPGHTRTGRADRCGPSAAGLDRRGFGLEEGGEVRRHELARPLDDLASAEPDRARRQAPAAFPWTKNQNHKV